MSVPPINLLGHEEIAVASQPAPRPVEDVRPPAPKPAAHEGSRRKLWLAVAAGLVVLSGAGTGGYLLLAEKPVPVAETPVKTTPVTEPAKTPTPTPTPVPETVTAPAAAPTAEHPQTVTVKAPHGLWLRSAPDPSTQSNVVAWMPDGAQVSVDQAGEKWWHGTYKNKSGYFNVHYTQ